MKQFQEGSLTIYVPIAFPVSQKPEIDEILQSVCNFMGEEFSKVNTSMGSMRLIVEIKEDRQ